MPHLSRFFCDFYQAVFLIIYRILGKINPELYPKIGALFFTNTNKLISGQNKPSKIFDKKSRTHSETCTDSKDASKLYTNPFGTGSKYNETALSVFRLFPHRPIHILKKALVLSYGNNRQAPAKFFFPPWSIHPK